MCKLDKCCCCIDLRIGAMVIAVLEIIGAGLFFFFGLYGLFSIANIAAGLCFLFGAIKYNQVSVISSRVISMIATVFYTTVAILVFVGAVYYGSQRGQSKEEVDWQWTEEEANSVTGYIFLGLGGIIVIAVLVRLYFWICVFSFLQRLKSGDIAAVVASSGNREAPDSNSGPDTYDLQYVNHVTTPYK